MWVLKRRSGAGASALVALVLLAGCATPTLGTANTLPERPSSLRAAFDSMPAQAVARVRILDDNVDAWVARYNAIESAKRSIDVQYFILDPDAYGLSLLGHLAEKARMGVKVRLMVDARGAFGTIRSGQRFLLQEAQRAGVDVRVYNPIVFQAADLLARGDLRAVVSSNHDKLIIVDGRLAISGGRNLSQDYLADPRDRPHAYVDMDALYEDEDVAAHLIHAFEGEFFAAKTTRLMVEASGDGRAGLELALLAMRLWLRDVPFSPEQLAALAETTTAANVAVALEGDIVQGLPTIPAAEVREVLKLVTKTLASQPRLRGALSRPVPPMGPDEVPVCLLDTHSTEGEKPKNTITDNLLRAILAAEREIVLQSPYFVLTPAAEEALVDAAARGVRITILTNSPASSDSPPTQAAFLKQWPRFLARAPTARLFVVAEARLMHSKVSVIDGVMSFVGSYNLDPLSAYVNGEVVGVIWGESQAQRLHHAIDAIISAGPPRSVEYTIARDVDGRPVLAQGQPVVTFGPDDHCTPTQLEAVRRYDGMLELLAPIL
jgi:putative cardiolipin synthase